MLSLPLIAPRAVSLIHISYLHQPKDSYDCYNTWIAQNTSLHPQTNHTTGCLPLAFPPQHSHLHRRLVQLPAKQPIPTPPPKLPPWSRPPPPACPQLHLCTPRLPRPRRKHNRATQAKRPTLRRRLDPPARHRQNTPSQRRRSPRARRTRAPPAPRTSHDGPRGRTTRRRKCRAARTR
jgi:hypothetical protein